MKDCPRAGVGGQHHILVQYRTVHTFIHRIGRGGFDALAPTSKRGKYTAQAVTHCQSERSKHLLYITEVTRQHQGVRMKETAHFSEAYDKRLIDRALLAAFEEGRGRPASRQEERYKFGVR